MNLVTKTYLVDEKQQKFFGYGPYLLLLETEKFGSLRQASLHLSLSYPKALSLIARSEEVLGYKLIHSSTGGKDGGGSVLTPEAKDLVARYALFREEVDAFARDRFSLHFPDLG